MRHELNSATIPVIAAIGASVFLAGVTGAGDTGVVVPDASQLIQFTITGPGTNAGVDNGDPASDELFQADHRSVFQGRALLVVRS